MKKLLSIGIIILFFGLVVNPISSINLDRKPINLFSNGDTLCVGGSGPNNYTRIQDAINDANSGLFHADGSPFLRG